MKKKILKSSILIAILGVALWSCNKDSIQNEPNSIETVSNQTTSNELNDLISNPQKMGEIHNDCLANVYNNMFSLENYISQSYVLELGESEAINYIQNRFSNDITLEWAQSFMEEMDEELIYEELSEQHKFVFDYSIYFKNFIDPEVLTIQEFNTLIDNKVQEAKNNNLINDQSIDMIIAIASVAKHSNQYWTENGVNWELFQDTPEALKEGYQKRVVSADISGAVKGSIKGAVGGLVAGGIGAGPGFLFGGMIGACTGSIGAGLSEYFGWW